MQLSSRVDQVHDGRCDRTVYLAAVVDGRLERTDSLLTNLRLLEIAPAEKQKIMNEPFEKDVRLDAEAILHWRSKVS
jgi:hypothetical protein